VLVELGVVEQRYDAVKEVLEGGTVTEVAERYGVTRQSLHNWLRRNRERGMAGLVDRSKRPRTCPHRTPARAEIRVIELRREHPRWGPRRLAYELARKGADPVPSRSSIYRILVRSGPIEPRARRRKRSDYRRWERARLMELWQLDVMETRLENGSAVKILEPPSTAEEQECRLRRCQTSGGDDSFKRLVGLDNGDPRGDLCRGEASPPSRHRSGHNGPGNAYGRLGLNHASAAIFSGW
jgi:transposase-like protein